MSRPTVSVVIPAYKAERTIARPLESLLAQTVPPDEILVVDDGSPDDVAGAVASFGDRVKYVRKPNGGAASARNLGIDVARGDLIAFLDADDYWEPAKLEKQVAVFRDHPEVGLVAARFYEEEPGRPEGRYPRAKLDGRGFEDITFDQPVKARAEAVFRYATRVWTGTAIVRREALGDDRFVSGLEPAEDRDLWIRIAERRPVYLMSDLLATYVLEPGSLSRTNHDRDFGNMLRVVHRHKHLLTAPELRRWETLVYRSWAACHIGSGHPGAARPFAWQRLRRQPVSAEAWWIFAKTWLARPGAAAPIAG